MSTIFDPNLIDRYFPMPSYRKGQRGIIEKILTAFNNGKRFVILEAPTGAGKSAIAYTVAQFFEFSYYLTAQKILQQQLIADFGEKGAYVKTKSMIDLKGRNNYECNYWHRMIHDHQEQIPDNKEFEYMCLAQQDIRCNDGKCKRAGMAQESFCMHPSPEQRHLPYHHLDTLATFGSYSHCPYWHRKGEAINAEICLMNFHSFLYQTRMAKAFHKKQFMVVDEAHSMESMLMSFVEFSISDRHFRQKGVRFPKLDTAIEYYDYFQNINLKEMIQGILDIAKISDDRKAEEEWEGQLLKYYTFCKTAESSNWVVDYKQRLTPGGKSVVSSTIIIKPIFIDKYANDYLFSMADNILMISATILDAKMMAKHLGIDRNEVFSLRTSSRFPKRNRPIYFTPCGSLSYGKKHETYPKLIKMVDDICDKYVGQRGIIHTHNFEIARLLIADCNSKGRFLFQENWKSKDEMLAEHNSRSDSVIVAPAMHEGLDLKDDKSRFAIICKVPFPPINDPQIKARMNLSRKYYDFLVALKMCQSYGRTIRSEKDWSHTYIIDGDFEKFLKRAKKTLPAWFTEAII